MIDLTGKTLANRYDLLALIGTGGMGAVYRARDRELDEIVALKVIRHDLSALPAMAERFRHEVKLARRVTHVNVARTFELGSADGVMFCTMELIDGESLTTRLAARKRLPVNEAVPIAIAMCEALEAAHGAGVIHRDIKPDNVLLAQDGRVVLADFGVAAVAAAEGELSGTPAYMAPEQARGEAPTPAADVYAVGVVLYEMLAGRRAFSGDVLTILSAKQELERVMPGAADAQPELAQVIGQATAREREQRLATAAALARALAPWARPARAPTQPHHRAEVAADEVRTIYVLGTRGFQRDGLYLAAAAREQLLARLRRVPLVRVLARFGELPQVEPDATVIAVDADDALVITIRCGATPLATLRLPLAVEQIGPAVELTMRALEGAQAAHDASPHDREVEDLLLRARHMLTDSVRDTPRAIGMLERAHELAPDEPRLTANLAIAHVRMAFFLGDTSTASLARAVELAARAISLAPHLADSQMAAAHVALNRGDAPEAAVHFRTAIACAPHLSEAHEHLGRLLLEAGYIDLGLARLDEILRVAVGPRIVRWDVARAWALEGRWDEWDRIVDEMCAEDRDRPMSRVRALWWQQDLAGLRAFREWYATTGTSSLAPGVIHAMFEVFVDNEYTSSRARMLAMFEAETNNARRRAFVGQMVVEAASYAGDLDTAFDLLARSTDAGLFDLHWLEKCPLLGAVRGDARYAAMHARIKARAEAILDALYGDRSGVATQDTLAATS